MIRYYLYGTYYSFKNLLSKNSIKQFITENFIQSIINLKKYNLFKAFKTLEFNTLNKLWGVRTPFIKTLFIRGIGYRLFILENIDNTDNSLQDHYFENAIYAIEEISSLFSENIIQSLGDTLIHRDWFTNIANTVNKDRYDAYHKSAENIFYDEYLELSDFIRYRYLIVRSGGTVDNILPLSAYLNVKGHKKERKLTIIGPNKTEVMNLAKIIYKMRLPSIYTGRGLKFKFEKIRKKKIRKTRAGGRLH